MRCIACNRLLSEFEEVLIKKNGEQEDMCMRCVTISKDKIQLEDLSSWDVYRTDNVIDFLDD